MEVKINITPEQVEQTVCKAIIDASIGRHIQSAVTKALQDYKMQNAIDATVEQIIRGMIREILDSDPELRPKIRAIVASKLTNEFIEKTFEKAVERLGRDW